MALTDKIGLVLTRIGSDMKDTRALITAKADTSALANKADLVGGMIPESQIPAVAISDTWEAGSQAVMLALSAQRGDIAIRTDLSKTFILRASPASTLANWAELRTPTSGVVSVAGKTGAVSLVKADVGLNLVDNTDDASKPVSAAQLTALNAKANSVDVGDTTINFVTVYEAALNG